MKKVYGTIADIILPAVVLAGVIAIFVGASLFGTIGKRMEVQGEDFSMMEDSQAVQVLCDRDEPVIRCVGKKLWDVGEILSVSGNFSAVDAEGGEIAASVLDIINQDGISVMECYQKESGQAVFTQRGVYTFLLEAMDGEQKKTTKRFSILVDGR